MNITFLGLIFDIAGAVCLGYEILVYPLKVNLTTLTESRIASARHTYEFSIELTRRLNPEVYTREEIEAQVQQYQKKLGEAIAIERAELPPFEKRRLGWGAVGLLLLVVGFILQAIGAVS